MKDIWDKPPLESEFVFAKEAVTKADISHDTVVTVGLVLGIAVVGYVLWKIALAMLSSVSRAIQGK